VAVDTAPLRRSPHLSLFGRTGLMEKKVGEVARKAKEEAGTAAKGFLVNQRFACHHHNQMFRVHVRTDQSPDCENIRQEAS
jgi:hypothetical protein